MTEDGARGAVPAAAELVRAEKEQYAGDSDRPLGSFLAIMAAYGGTVVGLSAAVRRRGGLPDRLALSDLALLSVGTHKLSRLLTKDVVTSPLRAPFTEFVQATQAGELQEKVRGTGPRRAIGALVTCPFCVGLWAATGFGFGLVLAPRATRLAASILTVLTAADALQFAYGAVEERAGS